ncbi:MAG: uroporphyrinogen decarboxylase family protein, partial [Armatimonadetes bacterium]|nr:uroporphyrinogen decarboxylase family protein [Armatimonadota bacterium]
MFVQTPGVFAEANSIIGLEKHLASLLETPDLVVALYRRIADWSRRYALNCLSLGADFIHISDAWGRQVSLTQNLTAS